MKEFGEAILNFLEHILSPVDLLRFNEQGEIEFVLMDVPSYVPTLILIGAFIIWGLAVFASVSSKGDEATSRLFLILFIGLPAVCFFTYPDSIRMYAKTFVFMGFTFGLPALALGAYRLGWWSGGHFRLAVLAFIIATGFAGIIQTTAYATIVATILLIIVAFMGAIDTADLFYAGMADAPELEGVQHIIALSILVFCLFAAALSPDQTRFLYDELFSNKTVIGMGAAPIQSSLVDFFWNLLMNLFEISFVIGFLSILSQRAGNEFSGEIPQESPISGRKFIIYFALFLMMALVVSSMIAKGLPSFFDNLI